jgi:hypothetical protein
MAMNRRGVFFTLASILFVSVLLLIFSTEYKAGTIDTGDAVIEVTSAQREKLELVYIPLVVEDTSYHVLAALSEDAYARDITVDVEQYFTEAMLNGTYENGRYPLATFKNLTYALNALSNASNQTGYPLAITVQRLTIEQVGAFEARYNITYNYTLRSRDGTVRFSRTVQQNDTFFLSGLPDRYYNDNTRGLEYRTVRPYRTAEWTTASFANMTFSHYYAANARAPSYFDRLNGTIRPSPYGIEVPVFQGASFNWTSMDWQFFERTESSCTYRQPLGPAPVIWQYHFDFDTLVYYNVTGFEQAYPDPSGGPSDCPTPP